MSIDEPHVALPSLYGAPAYARPPSAAPEPDERPFDPDELPIEAHQTDEEREFAAALPAKAYAPGGTKLAIGRETSAEAKDRSGRRPLRIREIAGRLLRS